jgi:hypothetical protein
MPLNAAQRRVARLEHEADAVEAALADLLGHMGEPALDRLQRLHLATLKASYLSPAERKYCRYAVAAGLCQVRLAVARRAVVEGEG